MTITIFYSLLYLSFNNLDKIFWIHKKSKLVFFHLYDDVKDTETR